MSQNGPLLEPLNMTLRNSICGKGSQKWTKKGADGRTDGRTDAAGGMHIALRAKKRRTPDKNDRKISKNESWVKKKSFPESRHDCGHREPKIKF